MERPGQTPENARIPEPLAVNFESIPQRLQAYNQWVVWKYAIVEDELKKPPFSPHTGRLASVRNPSTWGSFEAAKKAYETGQYGGVGIVLTQPMGIVAIDIDDCISDGEPTDDARTIVSGINSYAEASPSGEGIRIMLEGKLLGKLRRRGKVEIYEDLRYVTLTGHWIANTPNDVKARYGEIRDLYHRIFGQNSHEGVKENTGSVGGERSIVVYQRTQADEMVLQKALQARNGENFRRYYYGDSSLWEGEGTRHTSQSEADFTLVLLLLYWTNDNRAQVDRLFRQSNLYRAKWERVGENIIEDAIKKRKKKQQLLP